MTFALSPRATEIDPRRVRELVDAMLSGEMRIQPLALWDSDSAAGRLHAYLAQFETTRETCTVIGCTDPVYDVAKVCRAHAACPCGKHQRCALHPLGEGA